MDYLLDTHVVLWWMTEPEKLSEKARTIISDRHNKMYVSSASCWEMAVKQSIGRLTIPQNMLDTLHKEGFEILPLLPEECLSIVDLPNIHNDPFDRVLIAQAKLNDLVFITKDKLIVKYPIVTFKC